MKEKLTYICEKCGAEFATKEECAECENKHINPKLIMAFEHKCYNKRLSDVRICNINPMVRDIHARMAIYPDSIDVLMDDGKIMQYKFFDDKTESYKRKTITKKRGKQA